MPRTRTAKVHGHIEGVRVGMHFYDRGHLAEAGVHGRPLWGIHGTADAGAYAIVLNEGYEDDDDQGKTIIYTGQGKGRQRVGCLARDHSGLQIGDQEWTHGNNALRRSYETKRPVRVIRGPDGNPKCCPYEGYRYDGLYRVVKTWEAKGKQGFKVLMFKLKRLRHQDPLPGPYTCGPFWKSNANLLEEQPVPENQLSTATTLNKQIEGYNKWM